MPSCPRERKRATNPGGFTVLELVIVLLVIAITLAIAAQAYGVFLARTAARRAAEVFARDLALTRSSALRDRNPVTLVALESQKRYSIRKATGEVVALRDYGQDQSLELSQLQLDLPGDSVRFSARGIANLGGGLGSLGVARFTAGAVEYTVRFNSTGSARIEAP
jgi:prepilin-type N-terminal cleavage/methylation domain-containing protein